MTFIEETGTGSPVVREDSAGHPSRVRRCTMTSPEVFREEITRIVNHSWLYVGHQSAVATPRCDYVRRR